MCSDGRCELHVASSVTTRDAAGWEQYIGEETAVRNSGDLGDGLQAGGTSNFAAGGARNC
jgi:hypothetical protein